MTNHMTKDEILAATIRDTERNDARMLVWAHGELILARREWIVARIKRDEARNGIDTRDAIKATAKASERQAVATGELRRAVAAIENRAVERGKAGMESDLQEPNLLRL